MRLHLIPDNFTYEFKTVAKKSGRLMMKLSFNFKHLDYSKSLENYTQEEFDKISFHLLKEDPGSVFFSKSNNLFMVQMTIPSRLKFFKAESVHFDVYSAVDLVIKKIQKQLLKINKINKNHKKMNLSKLGKLERLNSRFEIKTKYRKAA